MKGLGNLSFGSIKRPKRANDAFCDCEEVEEVLWFYDLFIFERQFINRNILN